MGPFIVIYLHYYPCGLQGVLNPEGRLSEKVIWGGGFIFQGEASSAACMVLNRKYTPHRGSAYTDGAIVRQVQDIYIYSRKTVGERGVVVEVDSRMWPVIFELQTSLTLDAGPVGSF